MADIEVTPHVPEAEEKDIFTQKLEAVFAQRRIIMVAVVIVVAVAAVYAYADHATEKSENKAWHDVASALLNTGASRTSALEKAIDDNKGAEATAFARMNLVREYFTSNQIDKARKVAEEFVKEDSGSYFAPQMNIELGKLLEWDGRFADARAKYSKIEKEGPEYLKSDAIYGLARCFEREGDSQKAGEYYRQLRDLGTGLSGLSEISLIALNNEQIPQQPVKLSDEAIKALSTPTSPAETDAPKTEIKAEAAETEVKDDSAKEVDAPPAEETKTE